MVVEAQQQTSKEIHLLPQQADLLTNFKAQVLAALAGTGGGKTLLGYFWLHSRMEAYPGNTWGMAEPTYPLLSKVILTSSDPDRPTLMEYFSGAEHHPVYHAVDRIIKTDFGQIYLGSADNPDSMQGAALKGYWLDEAGLMKLGAYQTALQRCSMLGGQVLITTTPYNLGWLKSEVNDKADDQKIVVRRWRSIDRPGFPRQSYEDMRKRLPYWRFAMLYESLFERPAGIIYDSFDPAICKIPRFPVHKEWPRYSGHDFGAANPGALFYAQDLATGYFYLYHVYLPGKGKSVAGHVETFKEITAETSVIKRAGGSHQEDEIRQAYTAHGWPIQEPKIHSVEAGIERVYALHKLNKLFIFDDCYAYLDEKMSYSRKLDEFFKPTEEIEDKERFHLMDAERYILSDFTPETVGSRLGSYNYMRGR